MELQPMDYTGIPKEYTRVGFIVPEYNCLNLNMPFDILTNKGWKTFKEIDQDSTVATLNLESRIMEYHKIIKKYESNEQEYDIFNFKSSHLEGSVTANHRMLVQDGSKTKRLKFKEISKLSRTTSYKIPLTVKWDGIEDSGYKVFKDGSRIPMENWVAFLGIYIAEGWSGISKKRDKDKIYCTKKVIISQKEGKKSKEIEELLKCTPFKDKWTSYINITGVGYTRMVRFQFSNPIFFEELQELGDSFNKYIPEDIKNLSSYYLNILFHWMMLGDGTVSTQVIGTTKKYSVTTKHYFTASKRLADDVQEILIKMGITGNLKIHTITENGPIYRVTVKKSKYAKFHRNKKSIISIRKQKCKVGCIEVPNNNFLIRVNGKPYWIGNCVAEKVIGEMTPLIKEYGLYPVVGTEDKVRQIIEFFPDIIVYLRCGTKVPTDPGTLVSVDGHIAYFRSMEIPVFYYLDDAFFKANNYAPMKILVNCDETIVATQALVDYLKNSEYKRPMHLLRTHMDIPSFDMLPAAAGVMDKNKLNILFTSEGRIGTLMLDRICERMSQNPIKYKGVRIICVTSQVAQLRTIINKWRGIEKIYYERVPLVEYYGIFKMSDIVLSPGEPGDLNYFLAPDEQEPWLASKSCVKYCVSGAAGIPCISSPYLKEYAMAIKHEETGYIANDIDEWMQYIDLLVENEEKRKEIGRNARMDVEQNWHIYKRVEEFAKILKGQSENRVN